MTTITEGFMASSTLVPDYAKQAATPFVAAQQQAVPIPVLHVAPQQQQQQLGQQAQAPQAGVQGGGGQAVAGAQQLNQPQLIAALQQLLDALTQLATILQQQGVSGGGGSGTVGACGMSGCTMVHPTAQQGAAGAPQQSTAEYTASQAPPTPSPSPSPAPAPTQPTAGNVDPSTVKDKASTNGMTASAKRGLEEAHKFGLPLVSGKRSGNGKSDHDHGNAIDVSTLKIGVPESDQGTPQMKAFAEHMRQQGKAGKLNVTYVILDGKIASSKDDWAWRPYNIPGKSAAEQEALRTRNPGDYNRLMHYDHVHVSFK